MTTRPSRWWRWTIGTGISATSVLVFCSLALASWAAVGAGSVDARGTTMPAGLAPTVSANGNLVTVSWSAVTLPGGVAVGGYLVGRYNATTGATGTVGANCAGVVTATTCTEHNVPDGTWVYTDTPVLSSWTGAASSDSNQAHVAS